MAVVWGLYRLDAGVMEGKGTELIKHEVGYM